MAPPVTSSGLFGVPKAGSTARSAAFVSSARRGTATPAASAWSAAISQTPPEMETRPNRRSRTCPTCASSPAVNTRSSMLATRTMPSCRQTASNTRSSSLTSEPVCASAARAAASLAPIFMATTGLPAASARRAAAASRAASCTVSRNRPMTRVVHQEVEDAGDVHVRLVAGGDLVGEADALALREGGDEPSRCAALRDDPDRPLGDDRPGRLGGPDRHAVGVVDEAQAVRAEQRHALGPRRRQQRVLPTDSLRARLGEAGGQQHRAADAGGVQVGEGLGDRMLGDHHQGGVHRLADGGAGGGRRQPVHPAALPVHHMHAAGELEPPEIGVGGLRPDRTVGGTDQRDGAGAEQAIERTSVDAHGCGGVHRAPPVILAVRRADARPRLSEIGSLRFRRRRRPRRPGRWRGRRPSRPSSPGCAAIPASRRASAAGASRASGSPG